MNNKNGVARPINLVMHKLLRVSHGDNARAECRILILVRVETMRLENIVKELKKVEQEIGKEGSTPSNSTYEKRI